MVVRCFLQRLAGWLSGWLDVIAAGESYAGIYVPMLTREVVKGNKRGVKPHINIKVGYVYGIRGA